MMPKADDALSLLPVMDQIPEAERCTCEPKVEKEGNKYPYVHPEKKQGEAVLILDCDVRPMGPQPS
jgi:hypothetical protein